MRNPWVAGLLSFLIPGLGQLYLKEKAKGLSLLCITAGVLFALATNRSLFGLLLIGPLYLFVMIPATVDAYQTASGEPRIFTGESIVYVAVMLAAVGPFAIPLLWRSHKFSKKAKTIITVLVIVIMLAAIFFLSTVASSLDEMMKENAAL